MTPLHSICWQEPDAWLGDLAEYPDHWTQGESLDDRLEHLEDLHLDLTSGEIPGIGGRGEQVEP